MSYTSQKIQSMIDSNKGLVFTYNYSNPEILRFVHPISIVGNNVVVKESNTDKIKKFNLNGIQLYLNNQPIEDPECEAYKLNQLHINSKLEETQNYKHGISASNTPRRNWAEEYAAILCPSSF